VSHIDKNMDGFHELDGWMDWVVGLFVRYERCEDRGRLVRSTFRGVPAHRSFKLLMSRVRYGCIEAFMLSLC